MISVLMPVRNVEAYVEAAVDSILQQTFRDFELVLVDDGSTDATPDILARYAARDGRVRVIQSSHLGSAGAANLGLHSCTSEWVAMMHGDDVSLPGRLQRQYEMAQTDPEVVVWGTDGYHISSRGDVLSSFRVGPTSKEECRRLRVKGEIVQAIHPTVFLNRAVAIKAGGYDEACAPGEDIDLFDRMLKYGDLVTIPEPLLMYRVHGSALSMTKAARMALLRRFILARQRHRLATNEELTFQQFLARDQKRPLYTRVRDWMTVKGSNLYRQAGMYYGEGQRGRAAWCLIGALALRPVFNAQRLWTQVFSARARRNVKLAR